MEERLGYLKIALYVIGALFGAGVPLLMMLWTDGFAWEPAQPEYEQMIMGIFVTLGVFLILAARDPLSFRGLSGSPCGRASSTAASCWCRR